MPSQLVCRPEQVLPVAVLRVVGELDMVTAAALRTAVRTCLAAQPQAVLVDVARLRVSEPLALAVLAAVAREAQQWPRAPIVLCAPRPVTDQHLAQSPVHLAVQIAESCEHALASSQVNGSAPRLRTRLRPKPAACREARAEVARACAAWQLGELTPSAAVIATELVANVVRHAHTTMEFTLGLRAGRFSIAVRDGDPRIPQPADRGLSDPGGRGLRMVRELADGWGVLPVPDGKVVWATLRTTTGAAPASFGPAHRARTAAAEPGVVV